MVRHFRLLCFALFIVLILAVHTVQGQVAVPAFAPASPKLLVPGLTVPDATLAPENPAANHWGAPARFGLGQIAAELKQEVTLGTDVERDFDGIYAGFRWVTEAFSLSVEAIDVDSSDGAYDARVTNAALSLLAADFLAVGLGLDTSEIELSGTSDSRETPLLGVSVSLDERFFIGLAFGREYLDRSGGSSFTSDRAVQKVGLGFRQGQGPTNIHLEYFVVTRDPHETGAGVEFEDSELQTIVVEAIWRSILLAGSVVSFDIDNVEGTTTLIDVGWAPKQGLALLGHFETTEAEDAANDITEVTTTAISIAYQF